jgi:hypothetical protein
MDASLNSALDQSFVRSFVAIQIKLTNDSVINLIDGSGEVSFAVDGATVTFDGDDAIYGALATAKSFEDTVASDAPRFTFSIMPPSATATAELANPKHQGSLVRVIVRVCGQCRGSGPVGHGGIFISIQPSRQCRCDHVVVFRFQHHDPRQYRALQAVRSVAE